MNVEQLRELLVDAPGYLEVCAGAAGRYVEELELETIRQPYRDHAGRQGLNVGTVVVLR